MRADHQRRGRHAAARPAAEPVLIESGELVALLADKVSVVLLDVRWSLGGPPGRPEYEAGHLPGAHWIDVEHELSAPPGTGGRHPLPAPAAFEAAMRRVGVRSGSLVVAYDGATSLAAARLWWLLTDAGHPRVRVLNGGFAAWVAAGFAVASGPDEPPAPGDFTARPGRRAAVDAAAVEASLAGGGHLVLVDVRAPERYAGTWETVDPVAGHIPGALNLPSTRNHEPSGRFLPASAIVDRFAGVATEADGLVLYCGSGITAAQSRLAMESAGLSAAIYPGSWSDWITEPSRPVAAGDG